ncbi:catechol 2,3-dioxygenase [Cupriavidus basilensis OR16]|uniref:Catechol 2,3-dioxygenase n=1 Tax=Cupriavidus basilensis OR16 TaxID=1127483 RepID=H1S5R4_9BURK|nr:VOC family protein [Cupriavidus basilensis]EHP42146.1 catechol 2,3-dioxygenase [Cupriavidus basilensis OR16]
MEKNNAASGRDPAVHSLDHYALTVPDLSVAEHFLSAFGLSVVRQGDALEVLAEDKRVWARFFPGERKALAYLSFNCFAGDFEGIRRKLLAANVTFASDAAHATAEGLWFVDADGNLIQVKAGPKTSPDSKSPPKNIHGPADVRGATLRNLIGQVRPRRLSHVLLFTPDVSRAVAFYNDTLGLRLSDRSGDAIAFTHTPHGSDHHLLAFAKSSARGWHHAAWDVASVDEVGQGAGQMAVAGYKEGWGTGRHVLGSNFFHYVRDPWGSFCEYSADIDYISAGQPWPAGDYAPADSLYQWGPDVPPYFIHNTEAE